MPDGEGQNERAAVRRRCTWRERWIDDEATWRDVQEATKKLIAWDRPSAPRTDTVANALKRTEELRTRAEAANASLVEYRRVRPPCSTAAPNNVLAMATLESVTPVGEKRDDWTSEDKKQEAYLIREWGTSVKALLAGLRESEREQKEWADSTRKAKEIGLSEAENLFSSIGPRRSPS